MRTKVFVGNLSFATKENELAKEFEAAGKVISANIITRGPRSLGYGFVELDSEADAENAVKLLNKKEIDGRPINVEVAKAREEGESADKPSGGNTRGGSRGRGRGGVRGRGGFRGANPDGARRRFRRRNASDGEDNEGEDNNNEGNHSPRGSFRGRGGRGRGGPRGGGRGRGGPRINNRPRIDERNDENRTPSKTTLFVANLPFSFNDDGFGNILKEGSLAFKSAHVVKKKSGRSKGFGFIEFDNEVDQQKALNALNNKSIEGRELVVKVALTENKTEESNESKEEKSATTPATTPATTTATTTTPTTTTENKPATPKSDKK